MPQEFSAGAVIFHKNEKIEYLLLKYKAKHWDFPKGHIEKGESYEETIRREVKEETGLTEIEFLNGFKKSIRFFFRQYPDKIKTKGVDVLQNTEGAKKQKPQILTKKGQQSNEITEKQKKQNIKEEKSDANAKKEKQPWVFKMVTFHIVKSASRNVKISWEHQDFAWLPYELAVKKITHKSSKELLSEANEFIAKYYKNL